MSSINSSSYSLQAPVLAVLQQQSHKIQKLSHPHILCLQQQQTIQFPELKVSSITNVPLPGIRPPSGAMGPKDYLFTVDIYIDIYIFFADDTAILAQGSTLNYVIHTLQKA
ncbi:hypothetical protein AVEN_157180-1 [Araneus ventricosus]|uniref:Uncharacterized protein n=1 Tax=Araneus ventricosus TaxID=182803 RepID=A0A4Y2W6M4_ARAVE|nr:hypothetical protein AVEN_157180-1 [Araneus ventricosus]